MNPKLRLATLWRTGSTSIWQLSQARFYSPLALDKSILRNEIPRTYRLPDRDLPLSGNFIKRPLVNLSGMMPPLLFYKPEWRQTDEGREAPYAGEHEENHIWERFRISLAQPVATAIFEFSVHSGIETEMLHAWMHTFDHVRLTLMRYNTPRSIYCLPLARPATLSHYYAVRAMLAEQMGIAADRWGEPCSFIPYHDKSTDDLLIGLPIVTGRQLDLAAEADAFFARRNQAEAEARARVTAQIIPFPSHRVRRGWGMPAEHEDHCA